MEIDVWACNVAAIQQNTVISLKALSCNMRVFTVHIILP